MILGRSRGRVSLAVAVASVVALLSPISPKDVFAAGKAVRMPPSLQQPAAPTTPKKALVTPAKRSPSGQLTPATAYGAAALAFEPNRGQADASVLYLARANGYTVLLTHSGATIVLDTTESGHLRHPAIGYGATVGLTPVGGASVSAPITASQPLKGTVSYYVGKDPHKWLTRIPTYGRVTYHNVYPGIDLAFYSSHGQLEYDFTAAPGADLSQVSVAFPGADRLALDHHGTLAIHAGKATLSQAAPGVYQSAKSGRHTLSGDYVLNGANQVGFQVGAHDTAGGVTIDPVLVYSSTVGPGDGSLGSDIATGIGVDAAGNAYFSGYSRPPLVTQTGSNAFVTKLDANGAQLFTDYFGGSAPTQANGIAVDPAGNAYLTGQTSSTNFPTTTGAFQPALNNPTCADGAICAAPVDAFLTKFDSGGAISYSTYLGGSGGDVANAIALDPSGGVDIAGQMNSTDFPGASGSLAGIHGFLSKLTPGVGTQLVYTTPLAGLGQDGINGLAVDASGNAYLTGQTTSRNFGPPSAVDLVPAGVNAFAAKWNGSLFSYFDYLGGSGDDVGNAIAIDVAGNAYVTGETSSTNFPTTTGALQTTPHTLPDAFVTKVNPTGTALVYSTYLGGNGRDAGNAIAVDMGGHAFVTGSTASTDFPTANPLQATYGGGFSDAFIARLFIQGNGLIYSTYAGGAGSDAGAGIALGLTSAGPGWNESLADQAVYTVAMTAPQSVDSPTFSSIVTKLRSPVPAARANYALAYDSGRNVSVMFGGYNASNEGNNFYNDTWEYNGGSWTSVTTAHAPFPRYDASMVYSAAEHRIIMFGGWVPCGSAIICAAGDTWAYDGTDWTLLNPGVAPPARAVFGMTYDSARQRVVVFGGAGINGVLLNDTWEWNGTSWTQTIAGSRAQTIGGNCTSGSLPDPRAYMSLAYDAGRARTVLFSGTTGICDFNDTWEYDGSGWSKANPTTSPSPRGNYAIAYAPARARTVLYGGCLASTVFSDTWEWDGTNWTDRSEAYSTRVGVRFNVSATYDAARDKMVVFGGNTGVGAGCPPVAGGPLSDTWELTFPATEGGPPPPPPPPPTAAANLSLTVDESIIPVGTAVAKLSAVPAGRMPQILGAPASSPVGGIPVGAIPVGGIPVGGIPVGGIPVGGIPVGGIPVGGIDLAASPVGGIPVGGINLGGTPVGGIPVGGIDLAAAAPSLGTVLLSALPAIDWAAVLAGTPFGGLPLQTLTLKDVFGNPIAAANFNGLLLKNTGIGNTLLRGTTVASILLGGAPLGQVRPPEGLGTWCEWFNAKDPTFVATCDQANIDRINGSTLLAQEIAGAPVGGIPVGGIPVGGIPVGGILVGGIPVGGIPVGGIPVGGINLGATPVGGIPVGGIPTPDMVVDCGRIDCSLAGGKTLGDAAALSPSAIRPGATLSMLGHTIDNIPLGQLIAGLVPLSSLSWEKLAIDGLQDFAPTTPAGLHYHVSFDLNCATTQSLSVRAGLPNGFRYVANSSQVTYGAGAAQALAEPGGAQPPLTDTPANLTWNTFPPSPCIGTGATGSLHVVVSFRAQPGLDIGTFAASAQIATPGVLTSVNQAPVAVIENYEPNGTPASAPIIQPDQLVLSHIATQGNTDYFRLPVPVSGTRVTVYLSHIADGSDFDLVLGKPATASLLSSPVGGIPVGGIPIEDRGIGINNTTSSLAPETLQDISLNGVPVGGIPVGGIPVGGITVASVSQNRGSIDEVAQVVTGSETGFYTIQVTGYNGSTSTRPYVLRVRESAPVQLNCPAVTLPTTGTVGTLPTPGSLPAGTTTLFLINRSRMANVYNQADTNALLAKLTTLAGRADVKGAVIPIDGSAAVRAAYTAWDQSPCDIGRANNVVAAINALVATYRAGRSIRYIVMIGSDQLIPMARVPDMTTISNEANEARDLAFLTKGGTQAGALFAAEALGYYMTDDAYVTLTTTPWLGHELYLPTISAGRLIETPAEIMGQLDQYTSAGGILSPQTAFTSGYDFLTGGAKDIDAAMKALYPTGSSRLISDTWTRTDLLMNYLGVPPPGGTGSPVPGIGAPNAHYSHYLLEPAAANASQTGFTFSDLVSTGDLPTTVGAMAGRIIFTMGCHGGLNVPDTLLTSPGTDQAKLLDWAQAYARQQVAVYVANTGYGYGDTTATALSVQLMSLLGQEIAAKDGLSMGEKLVTSKHQYYDNMGAYGVYDEKALEEATFYGLPMYHLQNGGTTPSPTFTTPNGTDAATGLPKFDLGTISPALTLHGDMIQPSYYSGDNGTLATFYRPIQPIKTQDVTAAASVGRAHGVLITGLSTSDDLSFTPAIARPTIDLTSHEPPPNFVDNLFPANFVRLDRSNTLGNDRQRFILIAGQYRPDPIETAHGVERKVTSINASVVYSTSANFVPPLISLVKSIRTDASSAAISVEVTDAAGVARVTVLVLDHSSWHPLDLTRTAGTNLWTGTAQGLILQTGESPQVFAEAEDTVGNVGYSTDKGVLYQTITATSDTTPPTTTATPLNVGVSITISSATLTPSGGTPQQFGPILCWLSSGFTAPTVELRAVDEPGGSGVKQVTYSLSGAQVKALTTVIGSSASVKLTGSGMITVSYAAMDFAGNQEATHQLKVFNANPFACMPAIALSSIPEHGTLALSGSYTIQTPSGPVTIPFSFTITF